MSIFNRAIRKPNQICIGLDKEGNSICLDHQQLSENVVAIGGCDEDLAIFLDGIVRYGILQGWPILVISGGNQVKGAYAEAQNCGRVFDFCLFDLSDGDSPGAQSLKKAYENDKIVFCNLPVDKQKTQSGTKILLTIILSVIDKFISGVIAAANLPDQKPFLLVIDDPDINAGNSNCLTQLTEYTRSAGGLVFVAVRGAD